MTRLWPADGRRFLTVVALALFVLLNTAGPAVAQQTATPTGESNSKMDFLCVKEDAYGNVIEQGEPGYNSAGYKHDVVPLLQNVVGVFMVIGPVAGVIFALYASVAGVLQPGGDDGSNYTTMRRNSLLIGFGVPIFALGFKLLASTILPYNIGCIVPDVV